MTFTRRSSGGRQIPCLVRTRFLFADGHLLAVSSQGRRREGALWGLF